MLPDQETGGQRGIVGARALRPEPRAVARCVTALVLSASILPGAANAQPSGDESSREGAHVDARRRPSTPAEGAGTTGRRAAREPERHADELRDEGEPGGAAPALFDRDALGPPVGWETGAGPEEGSDRERAQRAVDSWLGATTSEADVAAGRIDRWYSTVREAVRGAFTAPDRAQLERERRAGMDPIEWLGEEAERYTQPPERPADPGGHAPATLFARSREDEQILGNFDGNNALVAPVRWHRATLRVVQDRQGRVLSVHVIQSSGMRSLDRAAIHAIESVAEAAPTPPDSVIGSRETISSEWAFEVGDVATRLSSVGGTVGPRGIQSTALGRGALRTRVELLRIVDAAHPARAERREAPAQSAEP